MSIKTGIFIGIAALGALLGVFYSGYSTADFTAHLDRQEHPIHCSLSPATEEAASIDQSVEGCKVALFSPYSSFARDRYWGGIPYSLLATGLFGFALVLAIWALATRRGHELAPALVLLFAGLSAAAASAVFFWLASTKLHTLCKTCAGTYLSSGILLVGAVAAFLFARGDRRRAIEGGEAAPGLKPLLIGLAVLLVEMGVATFLPVVVYSATLPEDKYVKAITSCETLAKKESPALVPLTQGAGGVDVVMVVDPLCDVCKAVHRRLQESALYPKMSVKAALMPLDSECNWMLKIPKHPGACLLSRAMICAGGNAASVLEFAYENHDDFMPKTKDDQPTGRIRTKLLAKFPDLAACVDSNDTTLKLRAALDFAVENQLHVETPQIFVGGKRLCRDDTDLGLEFAMSKLMGK